MQKAGVRPSRQELTQYGIQNLKATHWNLGSAQLVEKAIERQEGLLSGGGALVVKTGEFTGRSPKDKYVVREAGTETTVEWGSVNQPMTEAAFDQILSKLVKSWEGTELFVQDCYGGADPKYTLPIRVITQRAWHALFAQQLFIRPSLAETQAHQPQFTIYFAPTFNTNPATDGTKSKTCIAINFKKIVDPNISLPPIAHHASPSLRP